MSQFGNKSEGLLKLSRLNVTIPNFSLLDKGFFLDFLEAVGVKEVAQLIEVKNAWMTKSFETIRERILNAPISDQVTQQIYEAAKILNFPISIRSSASVEDSANSSAAGVFKTCLNVTKETLIHSVRQVLASLYDDKCIILLPDQSFHPDAYYMGLIFQEMIDSEWSGVAFSADPITGDTSEILIEMAEGLGEGIVSGLVDTQQVTISKKHFIDYNPHFFQGIQAAVLQAEKMHGVPIDLEWAYADGELYVLQCRPITTINKIPDIEKIKIFSMSGLNDEVYPYLGYLQKRYPKWIKKSKFYDFCETNHIKTNKWKFIIFNKELLKDIDFELLFDDYDSPYVSYHLNSQTAAYAHRNMIPQILKEFTEQIDENSYCVSFREFLPNQKSAISTFNPDGSVQIECISGKLFTLNSGIVVPTRYLINEQGKLIEESISSQKIWEFDGKNIDMVLSGRQGDVLLSQENLTYLFEKTVEASSHFGSCTLEWWIWNEKLYAADMSKLKTESYKNTSIISNGIAKGILRKLPQINEHELDELSMFSAISVCDSDFNVDSVNAFQQLKNQLEEWRVEGEIILYADRPYLFLAPFKDYVSGFVFQNASNLCHLSLILRESRIPALSLNKQEVASLLGQLVEVNADEGSVYVR